LKVCLGLLEDNDIYRNVRTGVLISTGSNPTLLRNRIAGVENTSGPPATLEANQLFHNKFVGACLATDVKPVLCDDKIYDTHNAAEGTIGRGQSLFKISGSTSFMISTGILEHQCRFQSEVRDNDNVYDSATPTGSDMPICCNRNW
ncbi:hypothetical protein OESDEN_03575, partial [Oesophagostomum dentatum]